MKVKTNNMCKIYDKYKTKDFVVLLILVRVCFRIKVSSPITSRQIDGETMETTTYIFFFLAPKSLQMVTVAMKIKDSFSLKEKL